MRINDRGGPFKPAVSLSGSKPANVCTTSNLGAQSFALLAKGGINAPAAATAAESKTYEKARWPFKPSVGLSGIVHFRHVNDNHPDAARRTNSSGGESKIV